MGNLIYNRCRICNDILPNNIVIKECFDCSIKIDYSKYKYSKYSKYFRIFRFNFYT